MISFTSLIPYLLKSKFAISFNDLKFWYLVYLSLANSFYLYLSQGGEGNRYELSHIPNSPLFFAYKSSIFFRNNHLIREIFL